MSDWAGTGTLTVKELLTDACLAARYLTSIDVAFSNRLSRLQSMGQ